MQFFFLTWGNVLHLQKQIFFKKLPVDLSGDMPAGTAGNGHFLARIVSGEGGGSGMAPPEDTSILTSTGEAS